MKLVRITNEKSPHFKQAWEIYESSFPTDERRDLQGLLSFLKNPIYSFFALLEDSRVVGILGEWTFPDFTLIEHLAIDEPLRNQGRGTRFLTHHLREAHPPVVGEVERPEVSDFARRRIGLYKRVGFQINEFDYIQPPYSPEKSAVPMRMISYPDLLPKEKYETIRDNIHLHVYGRRTPVLRVEK